MEGKRDLAKYEAGHDLVDWSDKAEVAPKKKRAPAGPSGTPGNPRKVSVAPPSFPRGYSMAHGKTIRSWSGYRKANRDMGLVDVGHKPPEVKNNEITYQGKKGRVHPDDIDL